jgi:hypothetical protein
LYYDAWIHEHQFEEFLEYMRTVNLSEEFCFFWSPFVSTMPVYDVQMLELLFSARLGGVHSDINPYPANVENR